MLCCAAHAHVHVLCCAPQGDSGATSTSELLWYNAIIALPLLTVITAANGEFNKIGTAAAKGLPAHGPLYFYVMVVGAATLGMALNYSMFLCTLHNSALTTTIVGVLRGVATVLLGFALDTVPFSPVNVAGITLNTAGGVWYSWIKFREKQAGSRAADKLSPVAASKSAYAKLPTRNDETYGLQEYATRPLLDGGGSGTLSVRVTH